MNLLAQIAQTGNCFKQPPAPKKGRKRLAPRSKKREGANREYLRLRKAFLQRHPYCQIWMKRMGLTENDKVLWGGQYFHRPTMTVYWAPRSQEIHHSRKPRSKYLNDTSTWFAASRKEHQWLEDNKSQARALGLLQ